MTGVAETREASLLLVEKYRDRRLADRVFDLAWTHSQVLLRQINATEADAQLYGQLAGAVVYANPAMRGDAGVLAQNHRGQSGLWSYSISGDLPIVLLQVADMANIELVRQLVQAQAYWRLKGLAVDLMIWNEDHSGYRQDLHDQILGLISAGADGIVKDRPGGIFVRPSDQISGEDRILFLSVARAVLSDSRGTLAEQVASETLGPGEAELAPVRAYRPARVIPAVPRRDLTFFNGLGGFTPDGREYIITTTPRQVTPAPWVNVLANANFGTVVSEGGVAYTWAENAHEFRLTPWDNDPVSDTGGEAYYLRDEETGDFWSPTPMPRRGAEPYVSRHGFGYSVFEHSEGGIRSETWVYVATDAAVKFTVIKIRNDSDRTRKLSATGYVQWVLGDLPPKTAMHVVTESDAAGGAIFARNAYNTTFAGRVAFFATSEMAATVTGDRREFLGRNGTLGAPAAMTRSRLSGKVGAGLDPCAAMQAQFDLAPGEEHQVVFTLGAGRHCGGGAAIGSIASALRNLHTRRSKECGSTGNIRWERSTWRRRMRRSMCWPTDGFSIRRSRAVCGRAADTTRAAARSVSATSYRTRWRWCMPNHACCGNIWCCARRDSSGRATYNTGGIRPRGAECAHTARTTICGCRWRRAAMWPAPEIPECSTRARASWKGVR